MLDTVGSLYKATENNIIEITSDEWNKLEWIDSNVSSGDWVKVNGKGRSANTSYDVAESLGFEIYGRDKKMHDVYKDSENNLYVFTGFHGKTNLYAKLSFKA